MIIENLQKAISEAVDGVVIPKDVQVEHPADITHGDFATNIALALAKAQHTNPHDLAGKIADFLIAQKIEYVESVEVAGPGFINIRLTPEYFRASLVEILQKGDEYGKNSLYKNKKIMVEFTDPNPFKVFHIGHLMSNTVGESLSRLFEYAGSDVKRATYQGDVGVHIAQSVWGVLQSEEREDTPEFLGAAYAHGAKAYKDNEEAKLEIEAINTKIYDRSDEEINEVYDWGKQISLDAFEVLYKRLGSVFDYNFFESEAAPIGQKLVMEWVESGLFQESEGAYVFKGEEYGLHTRVFINSKGLPTYEAKELALPQMKYDRYQYTDSFVITGNEVNDYFKVLLAVLGKINPALREKTHHIGHGMLRLPEGKMSSRTGNVLKAESLLNDLAEVSMQKIQQNYVSGVWEEKDQLADIIAVGAIKYSILKQGIGKDIIFEFDKALSFEGDSGPYIQYAAVRAQSILEKSGENPSLDTPEDIGVLEKYLSRFPYTVEHAIKERAPQVIVNYITLIASEFNSYYAHNSIGGTPYRLALTQATLTVLRNGLYLIGVKVPSRM